ncbi:angiopoietin-related protein 7-like [Ylistrum balloti]|uniref:angiopoietin-related protein 7-like n=1 Tax=Ylistrum balloti TaxID=509963 RepID=UPI00290586A2|nr:angiopoietin-related protein 7-like [Ylistrum balloti]
MDGGWTVSVCDMDGGWTIIQQRLAGFTEFDQTWMNYKLGFGKPYEADFWLGNENIWRLTNAAGIQKPYTLRVELTSAEGETRFAEYGYFRIEDEYNGYRLVIGNYSGNAGDAMQTQNGTKFSTGNYDHAMIMNSNCALDRSGGWWFTDCNHANLNGAYKPGSGHNGIFWDTWKEAIDSIKEVRMMIRRGD